MPTPSAPLTAAVEAYFTDLRRVRASGGATGERSNYGPLANLLNAVGGTLRPKVFCVAELADQGAGHPDFGLFTAAQVQKGRPRDGQTPERGVVEVKTPRDDPRAGAVREQVSRYRGRYRLVLVTNLRAFELVGADDADEETALERFVLAADAAEFDRRLETPRVFAREAGPAFGEYLCRALSHRARLAEPKDLAWLLASYARDALARVEAAGEASALAAVRAALEEALGVRFEGAKGARFFRSTLVQTLFYGVFAAWVLWARDADGGADGAPPRSRGDGEPPRFRGDGKPSRFGGDGEPPRPTVSAAPSGSRRPASSDPVFAPVGVGVGAAAERFDWRTAVWHLRAPVLRALFQQLSDPGRLQPLGLVEVLDWTAAALDRVDRPAFFARFREGEAVPYFYEPFLEAFDPDLRRQLGVWYTPAEVVRYMVARVDRALRDDLGVADGLAAENVYVLDPCCGTGAYLAEVLRRIAADLAGRGLGALAGARVRQAAAERVFGFEIMPAPFVVAHLQVGLTLQALDAPLAADGAERPGVFLTNALTGWEPRASKPLPFPELEEERDRAERVKRERPILVILGNPPYNGFAGMAVDEERELSEAYRATRRVRRPEGQGLNDLYVRFFRMAERRIAEKTGRGMVCFISNYSWLDGLSFTGMRERCLEAFDAVRIDCLNGDKYKTGKVAPDGSPDPSIFSTEGDPVGIQVGTAVATLVRKADHAPAAGVGFRHLWGRKKREELIATAEAEPDGLYEQVAPVLPLGLPFAPTAVSPDWFDWPALPELFPVRFHGVLTNRDGFLVDVDLDRLRARVDDYFNADLRDEEIARRYPEVMKTTGQFDARTARSTLLPRGPNDAGFVRFTYRPFDVRWLYWDPDTKLLERKRADYIPHVFEKNLWLSSAQHLRKGAIEPQACFTRLIGSHHLIERGSHMFPAYLLTAGDIGVSSGSDDERNGARHIESRPLDHFMRRSGDRDEDASRGRPDTSDARPALRRSDADAPGGHSSPSGSDADAPPSPDPSGAIGNDADASGGRSNLSGSDDEALPSRPNLSAAARRYLKHLGLNVEDLFHHVLAVLHDPAYRKANADALRMEWPRIPLPGWPAGDAEGAGATLAESAARGRELARLLEPDAPVAGVTTGTLRPEIAAVARPATVDGRHMAGGDFALTAGWGHHGSGGAVMPGQGRLVERQFTAHERAALGDTLPALGETTRDVHLNDRAHWANVPAAVWSYRLGGYQVLKKWLSYRERPVLGRPLDPDEVQHFTDTARRIAAILLATGDEAPV